MVGSTGVPPAFVLLVIPLLQVLVFGEYVAVGAEEKSLVHECGYVSWRYFSEVEVGLGLG